MLNRTWKVAAAALLVTVCAMPAAAAESDEQWDYYVVRSMKSLNEAIFDPTDGCKSKPTLQVLGRMGWELVAVSSLDTDGSATGEIKLTKPKISGDQYGTIKFDSSATAQPYIIFKRRYPHAKANLKC